MKLFKQQLIHVLVGFDDVHVIAGTKMRTVYRKDPAIEIGNTLKTKGRKRFLTLGTVKVASRAICPLNMDDINGSNATWQSGHTIATAHTI
jgi:hypothetical protein